MLRVDDQAFRTDTGRQRSANEDSFFVRAPIFVVADGMGGAQAGEVASKAAAEAFDRDLPDGPPEPFLRETIEAANREIHELARDDPSAGRDGDDDHRGDRQRRAAKRSAIGHVGDSRAYRLRGGKLERLTRDHSLVEEMRRKGQLTDAQAEDHPQRSIITRALGPEPEVEVDVQTVPAAPGDVFLICSDGLTTMLGEEQIAAAARRRHLDGGGGRGPWSTRPTAPAAATTSPRSPSGSKTPPRRRRRARGRDADRRRGRGGRADRDRGPPPRRRRGRPAAPRAARSEAAAARLRTAAKVLAAIVLVARDRLRRLVRQPPGLVPRHRRRRPGRALPRPSLRTALRHQALRRALREPDPDRLAADAGAATRSPATTSLPRRRRLA